MTDLETFLHELGLSDHLELFRAAEVDLAILKTLSEADLRDELGLPLGVRRKILRALHEEQTTGKGAIDLSAEACPSRLHPAVLATFLAHPWHGYCAHDHPRERLYWLVDTLEASARLATAIALAAFVAGGERLPGEVAARVRHLVHRPTLGQWLQLLRTLSDPGERPEAASPRLAAIAAVAERFDAYCPTGEAGSDPDSSLLAMRNALAHGGGFSLDKAKHYIDTHETAVVDLLGALDEALAGADLIGWRDGHYVRLWGPTPAACEAPTEEFVGRGPWLVDAHGALSLDPLLAFGPVQRRGRDGQLTLLEQAPVGQLYTSAERQALRYTPVGVDAIVSEDPAASERLRALFRLDEPPPASTPEAHGDTVDGYHWHGFFQEAHLLADGLIGRANELADLKGWLKDRRGRGDDEARIGWVPGAPGVGKSQLMAYIAAQLDHGIEQTRDRAIYYHRFRAGDARNSTRHFLRLLRATLDAWPQLAAVAPPGEAGADEGEALVRDVRARLDTIASLEPAHPKAPPPRLVVLLDGLDELARYDATIANLIRRLAVPGTVWLVAGRPEAGLDEALRTWPAEAVYPEGLPLMSAADIRAMLLENLGPLRYQLLERDTDNNTNELPNNPFVDVVVQNAKGLPLYVHLLLDDLERQRAIGGEPLNIYAEHALPQSLQAYYAELLRELSVGDLQRVVPVLLAALAVAEEPLDPYALAALVALDDDRSVPEADDHNLVEQALAAAHALVRDAPTPEQTIGYSLYHTSFRDYVLREGSELTYSIRAALRLIELLTHNWAELPEGALRNHLFRRGTGYALHWASTLSEGEPEMHRDRAHERLTSYPYLHARLVALGADGVTALATDYAHLLAAIPTHDQRHTSFRFWEAFFRERAHILRRGGYLWPAYRILLQLAVEHANDSPVTKTAEDWLRNGNCNWVWMRSQTRPDTPQISPCLRVLEGHTASIRYVSALRDNSLLSSDNTGEIRLWNPETGECLAAYTPHKDGIRGVLFLPSGYLLTWGHDLTLRLSDFNNGTVLTTLNNHTDDILGALLLNDGYILSWSMDNTLKLWSQDDGHHVADLTGHRGAVRGAICLRDGRILSWSDDGSLGIWQGRHLPSVRFIQIYNAPIDCVLATQHGWIALWPRENAIRRACDTRDADRTAITLFHIDQLNNEHHYAAHNGSVISGFVTKEGHIVSWDSNYEVHVWDPETPGRTHTIIRHEDNVKGVIQSSFGQVISWSDDGSVRTHSLYNPTLLNVLANYKEPIHGLYQHYDYILFWFKNGSIYRTHLFSPSHKEPVESRGPQITKVTSLGADRFAASTREHTIHVFDTLIPPGQQLPTHGTSPRGVFRTNRGTTLSCGRASLLEWNPQTGTLIRRLQGPTKRLHDVDELPGGEILCGCEDGIVRIWSTDSDSPRLTVSNKTLILNRCTVSRDKVLAAFDDSGVLRTYNVSNGRPISTLTVHSEEVNYAQFLDSKTLLSWSRDGSVSVTDISESRIIQKDTFTEAVRDVIVVNNDKFVVLTTTIMSSRCVHLYCRQRRIKTIGGHDIHGQSVCFVKAIDDRFFASIGSNNCIQIWNEHDGSHFCEIAAHNRLIKDVKRFDYRHIISWDHDCDAIVSDLWNGKTVARLRPHSDTIQDVLVVKSRFVVSWPRDTHIGSDKTVCVHDCAKLNDLGKPAEVLRIGWHGMNSSVFEIVETDGHLVASSTVGEVFHISLYHGKKQTRFDDLIFSRSDGAKY